MIVTAFGVIGAVISAYVWYKQVTSGPVLCIGEGCARVIRSRYGRLLGIPNGALGVVYFGGAAIVPLVATPVAWTAIAGATAIALPLYAYLTYLQFAVVRALCVWCLASAILTVGISVALFVG